jgi:hypothetical protein
VTVNGKIISKDTEPDLVLAPACYWELFLQSRLDELLRKKLPQNPSVRSDDTNVVVSVTECSERDLTKRFDETEIEWTLVVRQLIVWGQYFQKGKKLRVEVSFSYVEAGPLPVNNSMK